MNDRYLYRAKRTDNGEWVIGFYSWTNWINPQTKEIVNTTHNILPIDHQDSYHIDPSTICQCTAVPDRDNTIMFENDVVRESNGVRGVIRFGRYGDEKTDYGFYIEWEKSQPYWRNDIYFWQNELRVIGSYIDNPELLDQ